MGAGFKNFAAGNVLTADDVDGYLMRQAVMSFASAAARDSALSGVLEEGMVAYLQDTNAISYYTGAAWRIIYLPETSWSPSWTNLSVGNGTVTANYSRHGDMVTATIQLTFGTSTSISGNVSVSLPVTADISTALTTACRLTDTGTRQFIGLAVVTGTNSAQLLHTESGNGGLVNATNPHTWTTTDAMDLTITYLAA